MIYVFIWFFIVKCKVMLNSTKKKKKKGFFICFVALPEDIIKIAKDVKPVIEIQQKGNNFVITSKTPKQSVTNSFTIGKEAEITTMGGQKLKVWLSIAQYSTPRLLLRQEPCSANNKLFFLF